MSINKATGAKLSMGGLVLNGTEVTTTAAELIRGDLSANLAIRYIKAIAFVAAASTVEQDTGYDLPERSIVNDVAVYISAAASAASVLEVGLLSSSGGGDADGFLDAISSTGTGMHRGIFTTATSGMLGAMYVSRTYGPKLSVFSSGSTDGDPGLAYLKPYMTDSTTARSVTWTTTSTALLLTGVIALDITEFST